MWAGRPPPRQHVNIFRERAVNFNGYSHAGNKTEKVVLSPVGI